MHPFVHILGHKFMSYDLMTFFAVTAACIYYYHSLAEIPIKKYQVWTYIVFHFLVSFFGGMVLPLLYHWIYLHHTPWFNVLEKSPGRYFHSVFLSLLVYTFIVSKWWRWPVWKVLDRFIVGYLLGSAIGRIGCFLQGCCKGKPCDLPWAVHLPPNLEIARHPTQAYMFILETVLVAFLWYFHKNKRRYDGQTFWVSSLLYSVYRFLIEFVRTNPIAALGLTHAQLFSAFAIVLSSVMLLRQRDNFSDGRKI